MTERIGFILAALMGLLAVLIKIDIFYYAGWGLVAFCIGRQVIAIRKKEIKNK